MRVRAYGHAAEGSDRFEYVAALRVHAAGQRRPYWLLHASPLLQVFVHYGRHGVQELRQVVQRRGALVLDYSGLLGQLAVLDVELISVSIWSDVKAIGTTSTCLRFLAPNSSTTDSVEGPSHGTGPTSDW